MKARATASRANEYSETSLVKNGWAEARSCSTRLTRRLFLSRASPCISTDSYPRPFHIPRFLDASDDKFRFYGARIIRMFPDPSDVPLLTKAMTQALDEYETPLSRGRQVVTALISVGVFLVQFQKAVPKIPKSDGDIALDIIVLKWENQNKRKVELRGLEEKMEMWRSHHSTVIRKLITGGSW